MYSIIKKDQLHLKSISQRHHAAKVYIDESAHISVHIIECAEILENVATSHNKLLYVLSGTMKIDSTTLHTGDCVVFPAHSSCVLSGTGKLLEITY